MEKLSRSWVVVFALLLAVLILAAADLFVAVVSVVLLVFAGLLFAIFINGVAAGIAKFSPLTYRWAYAIVVLLLVASLIGGAVYTGASVFQQISELSDQLRVSGRQALERLQEYDWVQRMWPDDSDAGDLVGQASEFFPHVMTALTAFGWGITGFVVIFFVGVYVAYDPGMYQGGFVKLVRQDRREYARETVEKVRATLGWWLLGRIISMALVGAATAAALWLLGVPLPFTLGALAAFMTFVPNVGPIIAAVPQVLLAIQVGPQTVLYVIIFNFALQVVETYMVTPIVDRYEVALPPALTIFVQLIMIVMFGVIGMMMAAPITAGAMVLVQTLYIRDRLGDPEPGELSQSL